MASDTALASPGLRVYTRFMDDVACYCAKSRRAARLVTAVYDRALEPAGLKITQFSLLRAIERRAAPSITDLAEATGLDRSTLGRNLRVLAKGGLLVLGAGDDERTRIVTLTPAGQAAIAQALPLWKATQRQIEQRLPQEAGQVLDQMVAALLALPG